MSEVLQELAVAVDRWIATLEGVEYVLPGRKTDRRSARASPWWVVSPGGLLTKPVNAKVILVECGGRAEGTGDAWVFAIPPGGGRESCRRETSKFDCQCEDLRKNHPALVSLVNNAALSRDADLPKGAFLDAMNQMTNRKSPLWIDQRNTEAWVSSAACWWNVDARDMALRLSPNPVAPIPQ
jgi:hypothetical protein